MEHKTEHNDNSYLSVIKYTCDHGYMENSVTDDGHYSCDADGHWYNTQLGNHLTACKEVKAGEPLVVLDPAHPPVSPLVPKGASPWSALIVLPDHSIHNGFLVFDHTVLTSLEIFGEQQITNEMIQGMKVYLGVRCRHDMEKAHAYNVSNIIYEAKNKFTIVHLVEKVHYGNYIVPIAVPHEDLVSPGASGIAAGWDVGHHDKPGDHVYLTVQSVEDKEACMTCLKENYPQNEPDFTGLFCTRARDSSIRLEDHDDGLALEIRANGTSYAAGLLSTSKACDGDLEVFLDLFAFEPLYQQLQKLH
ncbi:haptoglobin-like [Leucoraja erinacea]|uniref:haptoglobin-like n=1 Tax=Leucoraja erinaceus TaxID=7782 RepID=UPI0024545811|nr:haptoglobin-like [Leucoraja erinacea]